MKMQIAIHSLSLCTFLFGFHNFCCKKMDKDDNIVAMVTALLCTLVKLLFT